MASCVRNICAKNY